MTHNATITVIAMAVLAVFVVTVQFGDAEQPPPGAEHLSTNEMLAMMNQSDMDPLVADQVALAKRRAHAEAVKAAKAAKAKAKKEAAERAVREAAAERARLARSNPSTEQNKAYGKKMNALKGWDRCWPSLLTLWNHESGWNERAENPSSGAYGIPQSLPGNKMASAGGDWRTSSPTQIAWGLSYIKARYGDPCGAWAFWQRNNWY